MSSLVSVDERMLKGIRKIIPNLDNNKYKGQAGKIGIFGGSLEYTGAPYYAAMSALRTGADLVHIFCSKEAGMPIKSYSPELIVHPILDLFDAMRYVRQWLERFHVIVIGPGLGRDEKISKTIVEVIAVCRDLKKPLIVDADGLFFISQKPSMIKDYPQLILTPNAMELSRLFKTYLDRSCSPNSNIKSTDIKLLAETIGKNVVILNKGAKDIIVDGAKGTDMVTCGLAGSGRRCGGQGDLVAGSLAVFWHWALNAGVSENTISPAIIASYAASKLIRECNAFTYKIKQRGMLVTDMVEQIPIVFAKIFETHLNK